MSGRSGRYARETKGHGAIGFLVTFVLIAFVIVIVIFFVSDTSLKGPKGKLFSIFYPQKYEQQVQQSAAEFNVDESLIYAVMRTESSFRPDAESHAGALGLMQLMPSTFDWLQEKLNGEIVYDSSALLDPAVNIRYGTYLLSILLDQYDNLQTAVAAYNAGTTTVDGWLSDSSCSSDGKTLTNIPYEETKNYVNRVQGAFDLYSQLYD